MTFYLIVEHYFVLNEKHLNLVYLLNKYNNILCFKSKVLNLSSFKEISYKLYFSVYCQQKDVSLSNQFLCINFNFIFILYLQFICFNFFSRFIITTKDLSDIVDNKMKNKICIDKYIKS